MKFNAWSKKRRELGVKLLTSRSKPHTDDPDVQYIVGPLPWGFIRDFLWRDEGALCPEELQSVINQIHRKKVPDDRMLYVHVLKSYNHPWEKECHVCNALVKFRWKEDTPDGCRYECPDCGATIPVLRFDEKPTLSGLIQGEVKS